VPVRGRAVRIILGILISLVAIYLAAGGVDWGSVWATLARANLPLVGLALGSVLVNTVAKAARWKLLMGERGAHVPLRHALRLHLVGQMLNNLLPARVGDLSRIYMAGELGIARSFVLGTVAVEKVVDMLCYVLIFALLLLLMPLPAWVSQPAYVLVVLTAITILAGALVLLYRRRLPGLPPWALALLPARYRARANTIVADGLDGLHVLADGPGALRVALWSTLIWFTAALTNGLAMRALQLQLPAVAALFVLFVLVAGINIPAAPGRIGVFEYLCVLALAVFGVGQAPALGFGLLLHVLVYLPPVLGGLLALWGAGGRAARPPVGDGPVLRNEDAAG
jgi:uncharacterized membrane protein YbhN (UPF0104 family)